MVISMLLEAGVGEIKALQKIIEILANTNSIQLQY